MRLPLLFSLLAGLPAIAHADCTRDTTRAEPRTLFGNLGIKALHIDEAGGNAPVNGGAAGIGEARLVFAHCKLPAYSFAIIGGGNIESPATAYVEPQTDYHPRLSVNWTGLEITRRWRDSSIFHPMVSFAAGTISTGYYYSHELSNGNWDYGTEGSSRAAYYTPSIGIEASLFKYMSVYWMYGTRFVGSVTTPNVDRMSGSYSVVGLGFGKFR